ncbi:MAG: hypothetical protein JWM02_1016 [Frankiales bacterium]|nr:hypothetical protein [Frankiales bacterium]
MIFRRPIAGRLVRPAVVVLFLFLLAGPAQAAGTGGVDISPYPSLVDGKQLTAFHAKVPPNGDVTVQYALRNVTDKTATARLYSTMAQRDGQGAFTIGVAGSSPYLGFPDQKVSLKAHETRLGSFTVHPGSKGRPKGQVYGAIVVEVTNGSVVQQAATVVYLQPGPLVPLPLLIVLIAVGVLALATLGFVVAVRRRH